MATTDNIRFAFFQEESWGVAPSPSTLQTLLITDESLTTNFETIESESVSGDRQIEDVVRTGRIAEGDINFELIYGNADPLFAGALADEFESDVIVNGSDLISFGFQKHFTDLTNIFYAFAGVRVDGLSLDFALESIITGSISVLGKGGTFPTSTIGDGSPTAAVTTSPMVTLSSLTINEGGGAAECPTAFSFETTNELRQKRCLGEDDISGINLGIFRATGTLEAYFESKTYVDKLVADTPSEFEIITQDSAGNSYTFTFPRIKFQTLDGPANTGRSSDVMQTLGWTAFKDPSAGYTMRIERATV